MPNEITIQPGSIDLVESFHECFESVARERVHLASLSAPTLEAIREFTLKAVEGRNIRLFAVDGTRVVGWCDIFVGDKSGFEHAGSLGMGVLKAYRRQGLGYRLVQAALGSAWDEAITRIELEVFASNIAAISLYTKLGFEREGLKRRARYIDGHYDDVVIMSLVQEQDADG